MKSHWFFANVPQDVISVAILTSNFQIGNLPIKYLGLPLITNKLTARDCLALVNRICAKIDSWTCRFLKFAGRLQLIKAILFGIHSYWSMYLFLPKKVLKKGCFHFIKFSLGGKTYWY